MNHHAHRKTKRPRATLRTLAALTPLAALGLTGCMGTPPQIVVVEPTFVLEHVADPDSQVLADWPVLAQDDVLVQASRQLRNNVAELAYLQY